MKRKTNEKVVVSFKEGVDKGLYVIM